MTLIFDTVLEVVKVQFLQNFIKLSAAVHELSCRHFFDDAVKTILPSLPRALIIDSVKREHASDLRRTATLRYKPMVHATTTDDIKSESTKFVIPTVTSVLTLQK